MLICALRALQDCKSMRVYLLLPCLLLVSCSDTPNQYSISKTRANPDRTLGIPIELFEEPSLPDGGHLLYKKPEQAEVDKDTKVRKNSLSPVIYETGSAGNINMETEYEDSLDILTLRYSSDDYHYYRDGIIVLWREDPPRTPSAIFIRSRYQGAMDFGPYMGGEDQRYRKIGQHFTDQFSIGVQDIQKDEKARNFITSLYRFVENTEEDCLATKKCTLTISTDGNYLLFTLPKMYLFFANNERRTLVGINIIKEDNPGCFGRPFDLSDGRFFCVSALDGAPVTLSLGETYSSALQKSGISPELPIFYENNIFIQATQTTYIGWKRTDFETEPPVIPEESHLSLIIIGRHYTQPLLLKNSLIKVTLSGNDTVQIDLEPLTEQWTTNDIEQKVQAIEKESNTFYLSANIPQVIDNYILQKNLLKALLSFLEAHYKALHPSSTTYKRLYGEYDDKHSLQATALLLISFQDKNKSPLIIELSLEESTGYLRVLFAMLEDSFAKYTVANQKPVDLSEGELTGLNGFNLGDKIYLRNKDIGAGTAIVAYPVPGEQFITTLATYSPEMESSVVYESGRDKNITYQLSSSIAVDGATLFVNPTFQEKTIEDKTYEEYEINSIFIDRDSFFTDINNLCAIEGFNLQMGMYDGFFIEQLVQQVTSSTKSCFYIAPQDPLFSGLKRNYFFPKHKIVLGFNDRELSSLRIYKKPSEGENSEQ